MCAKANLVSCAPACDEQTYGFLLSIEIDGRGTVMTCNKVDGVFSWQGQASLGGYIGANFDSLFSSVVSGAAGTFMGTLTHDAGIGTDLTIQPGQAVLASGDITSLAQQPPLWGSGGFTVQERGSLSLTYVTAEGEFTVLGGARGVASLTLQSSVMSGSVSVTSGVLIVKDSTLSGSIVSADTSASLSACTLGASVTLTTTSIWPSTSSMSLDNMAVPSAVLTTAKRLSGVGSTLRLSAITVLELPNQVALTGTMTVDDDSGPSAPKTIEPPGWGVTGPPVFVAVSGPCVCTVSDGGSCVGRPGGYGISEDCAIFVVGGGGVLGACSVFDMENGPDYITLPDGSQHSGSDCPAGAALTAGDGVSWTSNGGGYQGSVSCNTGYCGDTDNGCVAKGTCGLPWSLADLGGGWQICFA